MSLTLEIASDLDQAGRSDDGQPFLAECYYILATDERGNRWRWYDTFHGARLEYDEEGCSHFADTREQAKAEVSVLLARMHAHGVHLRTAPGKIGWEPTRPAYGSPAYEAYGADDDIQWERSQA